MTRKAFLYACRVVKRHGYIAVRKDRYLRMRKDLQYLEDVKPLIADGLLADGLSQMGSDMNRQAADIAIGERDRARRQLDEIRRAMQRAVDGEIDAATRNAIIWRVLTSDAPQT